jgi:hypothetical protein
VVAEDGGGREGESIWRLFGRPTGLARADREAPGPWETFTVRWCEDKVGFQAPNGAWLSAQPDGTLVFNRMRDESYCPGAWEGFHVEQLSDGAVALITSHGTYVRAPEQGGGELRHDQRDGPGIDETFWPSAPLRGPPTTGGGGSAARVFGQLRLEAGGGFVDDHGPVLPVLCHFGDALSRWSRGQQAAVSQDLDRIKSAGYDGIRFWTTLGLDDRGGGYWAGRAVGPTYTPDYWAHLEAFLIAVRDRGLVAQVSQGDVRPVAIPDRTAFARQMAEVISRVGPHVVALWEGANESRDTGEPDAARLATFARELKARLPSVLVGLSSYTGTEDVEVLNSFSRSPADLFVVHGYRGGHWWDKVRHIFSLRYEGKPSKRWGWQGEPAGPGQLVSAIDNRHELDADALQLMAAMSLLTRQAWVHFSGPGVISDHANGERLENMPGFWEVPRVKQMLPADVMRYDLLHHSGESWSSVRVYAATGENRADCAVYRPDGRRACVVYGEHPDAVRLVRQMEIDMETRLGNKGRVVYGRVH